MSRSLTDEECRILIAAEEERLFLNTRDRWEIEGEVRPDRRTRQSLGSRHLIAQIYRTRRYRITAMGKAVLKAELLARRAVKQAAADRSSEAMSQRKGAGS